MITMTMFPTSTTTFLRNNKVIANYFNFRFIIYLDY